MPIIRPSSDLRNSYNEISTLCHETNKPIYITKNGAGDLAVMSIELYELLAERYEEGNKLESNMKPVIQTKKEEEKAIETNHRNKDNEPYKPDNKPVRRENENKKIENNYENKDNKTIKNNPKNSENKDTKMDNTHINKSKEHAQSNIFKRVDTEVKTTPKQEPESAHELLQEIEIEPIVQPTAKEKSFPSKDIFRSLDTEIKTEPKKEKNVAKPIINNIETNNKDTKVKDIKNTDWIFEDLNKMLNDIKV